MRHTEPIRKRQSQNRESNKNSQMAIYFDFEIPPSTLLWHANDSYYVDDDDDDGM